MSVVRGLLDTVHNWNLNIFAIAQCTLRVQPNLVSSISQLAKIKLNLLSSCSAYESGLVYRRGDFKIYLFATCISTHTKGGFYSEGADAFVISSNSQTSLFS